MIWSVSPLTKVIAIFSLITGLTLVTSAEQNPANAGPEVEVSVAGVYAPIVGFDDNDHVVVVVDGVLPNACYTRGNSDIRVDKQAKTVTVVQYATRTYVSPCEDDSKLPDQLRVPVRFMAEVSVGQLEAGEYTIQYQGTAGQMDRKLNVAVAPTVQVDNLKYANTTGAFVYEVVPSSAKQFKVILTGYLNSSCAELDDKIIVTQQDDVVILLPQVKLTATYCLPAVKDFVKEVVLDTPKAGRYLLHVRSMNGSAVNRMFTVK